jgi:hypothetical protein
MVCKRVTRTVGTRAVALTLLLVGCGDGTRPPEPDPGIRMLDPGALHFGKSYADWAVAYMKWQLETPLSVLWDVKGCTTGQSQNDHVVFLDQSAASKTQPAACSIATEESIFFPLLPLTSEGVYYTDSVMPVASSDASLLEDRVARYMRELVMDEAEIRVDGRVLHAPTSGKLPPTPYDYQPWPGDNLLYRMYGIPDSEIPATVKAFVAGYWVLLPPLAGGQHRISLSIHADLHGKVVRNEFSYDLFVD